MTNPTGAHAVDAHSRHDHGLIAAHVSGGLDERSRIAAVALVAACAYCADLASDLRSIAAATRAVPPRRLPPGRTFTLDAGQAARLRRRSGLLAFLRPFGRGGFFPARPIGVALSALGLVGILVSAGVGGFPTFLAVGAPTYDDTNITAASAAPEGQSTDGSGRADATPAPPEGPNAEGLGPDGAGSGTEPSASPTLPESKSRDLDAADGRDVWPLLAVSAVLVVAGVALLLIRRAAVRLT